MSESNQIEDNFRTLNELFTNMSQAIKQLERKQVNSEKENKMLHDANNALQQKINGFKELNQKQTTMILGLQKSLNEDQIELLKTELHSVKQENVMLKNLLNNKVQNVLPSEDSPDTIENYNFLLQEKIVGLEKQLLQNETVFKQNANLHDCAHNEEVSALKTKNNILFLENKSLKEQLSNFRNLHKQVISETQSNNVNCGSSGSEQRKINTLCVSTVNTGALDQNELQPIQVNVIDCEIEDIVHNIDIDETM